MIAALTGGQLALLCAGSIVVSIFMGKKWPMYLAFGLVTVVMFTSTKGGA